MRILPQVPPTNFPRFIKLTAPYIQFGNQMRKQVRYAFTSLEYFPPCNVISKVSNIIMHNISGKKKSESK